MLFNFSRLITALLLAVPLTASATHRKARFRVTVQNVTAGNVLSPFLVSVFRSSGMFFELGQPASPGVALVAETGNTMTLEGELAQNQEVAATAKADGPAFAGESKSVEFEVDARDLQRASLQLIAMIGRSNDSFVSVKPIRLAHVWARGTMKFGATNYDAGSEENTGNVEDFGPAGHPVAGAEGRVSIDRGLNPRGNAPETFGWGTTAAVVTLERLN